jgi:HAD superfamily hydrolase (TIGR01509 family)
MNMKRWRGILLDLDGTLLDSNDAHAEAWAEAMADSGYHPDFQEIRRRIGMGGDFLLPEVIGIDAESETGKRISRRRREIFESRYLPGLRPFAGAQELVRRLRDAGYRMVMASSSRREELDKMLDIVGIVGLVDAVTSASDVENSKPAPDILEAALSKLDLSPGDAVLLGDTPYDAQAASKLGLAFIAVTSGGWSKEDFPGAVAVYADVAELLARFDESPLRG